MFGRVSTFTCSFTSVCPRLRAFTKAHPPSHLTGGLEAETFRTCRPPKKENEIKGQKGKKKKKKDMKKKEKERMKESQ